MIYVINIARVPLFIVIFVGPKSLFLESRSSVITGNGPRVALEHPLRNTLADESYP